MLFVSDLGERRRVSHYVVGEAIEGFRGALEYLPRCFEATLCLSRQRLRSLEVAIRRFVLFLDLDCERLQCGHDVAHSPVEVVRHCGDAPP